MRPPISKQDRPLHELRPHVEEGLRTSCGTLKASAKQIGRSHSLTFIENPRRLTRRGRRMHSHIVVPISCHPNNQQVKARQQQTHSGATVDLVKGTANVKLSYFLPPNHCCRWRVAGRFAIRFVGASTRRPRALFARPCSAFQASNSASMAPRTGSVPSTHSTTPISVPVPAAGALRQTG